MAQPSTPGPLTFEVAYPEKLSRGKLLLKTFLGWLYVGIPHWIILYVYGILVVVAVFFAWWAILFTQRYPKGLFDFVVGYTRWVERVNAYLVYLMTDKLPPYSNRP